LVECLRLLIWYKSAAAATLEYVSKKRAIKNKHLKVAARLFLIMRIWELKAVVRATGLAKGTL
jgi:hypothetical protein